MAMAFTFRVLENNARNYILEVVGVDTATVVAFTSDGSSNGIVAANGYTGITTSFKVRRIQYSTFNCAVRLQQHATSNTELAFLAANVGDDLNMTDKMGVSPQGIQNDKGTGATGDIDILTYPVAAVTAGAGIVTAAFTMIITCIKGA